MKPGKGAPGVNKNSALSECTTSDDGDDVDKNIVLSFSSQFKCIFSEIHFDVLFSFWASL